MSVKETLDKAIEAVGQAQSGMDLEVANKMFRAAIKLAKTRGFNVGFVMSPAGNIEAQLIPVFSLSEFADGWILSEWDELALREMHVTWNGEAA